MLFHVALDWPRNSGGSVGFKINRVAIRNWFLVIFIFSFLVFRLSRGCKGLLNRSKSEFNLKLTGIFCSNFFYLVVGFVGNFIKQGLFIKHSMLYMKTRGRWKERTLKTPAV